MCERIDHAAEARKVLDGYPGLVGNRPFDVALVQATLALVEVQEAGNRIAAAGVIAQLRREAIESRRAGMISAAAADGMFAKTNCAVFAFLDEYCGGGRA